MAGSLTLGGMVAGTASGNLVYGPSTIPGKRLIGESIEVNLEANVDFSVKVPSEAQAFAVFFQLGTGGTATEVKVGSNLVATSSGFPVATQGFFSGSLFQSITELKFKAATPPATFNVVFV